MQKQINYQLINDIYLPTNTVTHHKQLDENNTEYDLLLLTGNKLKCHYINDYNLGLVPCDTKNNNDLVASIMELGPAPTPSALVDFFNTFGFFLPNSENEGNGKRYRIDIIIKLINYIQKIIYLNNALIKYELAKNNDVDGGIDYTETCNYLLDLAYTDFFHLESEQIIKFEEDSQIKYDNEKAISNYRFGFEYTRHFFSISNYIHYFNEFSYLEDKAIQTKAHPYICYLESLFDKACPKSSPEIRGLDYTPNIYFLYFIYDLNENKKLSYNTTNTYAPSYDMKSIIPRVINMNYDDENTANLQKKLMKVLKVLIPDQINRIIKNINPIFRCSIQTTFEFNPVLDFVPNNLLEVVFLEISLMSLNGLVCRGCCMPGCNFEKGKHFFIVDATEKSKRCYDSKCRKRITMQLNRNSYKK